MVIAFGVALALSAAMTPVARRIALSYGLVDRPTGWKKHVTPTPYLGGVAVLAGVTGGSLVLISELRTVALLLAIAWALSIVGSFDDAVHLHVRWRLAGELSAACLLWAAGRGWQLDAPEWINLLLTCLWIVAVVNAFNLIDLMDTVASSVLVAAATVVAILAYLEGNRDASVISIAIVGAGLGFLPFNNRPSRIFLGDGGTMPLGFLAAALIILSVDGASQDSQLLLLAPLLFLVPLLDAAWRALKRLRAGVSLMTAGHDSVANSLQRVVGRPARVGLVLALAQAASGTAAVVSARGGALAVGGAALLGVGLGLVHRSSPSRLRQRVSAVLTRE